MQRSGMTLWEAQAWGINAQREYRVGSYQPGTPEAEGMEWAESFPSDAQFKSLWELARGVYDFCALLAIDPDAGDHENRLAPIIAATSLVWGDGSPDSPSPPIEIAMRSGFTKKQASVAFMSMIIMCQYIQEGGYKLGA